MNSTYQRKRRKRAYQKYFKLTLVVALLSTLGYLSYLYFWPTSLVIKQILKAPGAALSFFKGEGEPLRQTNGRTNVLLLGIDKRSYEPRSFQDKDGRVYRNGFRSDTILLASVDLMTKDTVLISLPRDLWVKVPLGGGLDQYGKINAAYSLGHSLGYRGGGLALAKKVVEDHLGISVHYTLSIDFDGFKKIVDTLGGVMVNVENSFEDWSYPIEGRENDPCGGSGNYYCRFERIKFEKGFQFMDGSSALKFVRSRMGTNDEGNDFARARRQQRVMLAIRNKALTWQTLSDPIKVAGLVAGFGETVETDFDIQIYPQVYKLLSQVDLSRLRSFVLDPSAGEGIIITPPAADYGGAYVLIPRKKDWSEIQSYVREIIAGANPKQATSSAY